MTTVLLVRHGRTPANATGILAGRAPGVPLDAHGRRQARSLGNRLRGVPLAAVVHSPLERCVQTTDGLLRERTDVNRHVDDRLIECDYGQWTGCALAELAEEPLWPVIQAQPSAVTFPGGESLPAMAERAVAAVRGWVGAYPEATIAVVSHGDVVKAILSEALGQPFDEFQRIVVGPGSLSIVQYGTTRPMVLRMNDTGRGLPGHSAAARPTVGGGSG
ncbi:MAG: MSMEG_4193 family putative phosphomutase [Candidatus Nanopelagicales bacterium]